MDFCVCVGRENNENDTLGWIFLQLLLGHHCANLALARGR